MELSLSAGNNASQPTQFPLLTSSGAHFGVRILRLTQLCHALACPAPSPPVGRPPAVPPPQRGLSFTAYMGGPFMLQQASVPPPSLGSPDKSAAQLSEGMRRLPARVLGQLLQPTSLQLPFNPPPPTPTPFTQEWTAQNLRLGSVACLTAVSSASGSQASVSTTCNTINVTDITLWTAVQRRFEDSGSWCGLVEDSQSGRAHA